MLMLYRTCPHISRSPNVEYAEGVNMRGYKSIPVTVEAYEKLKSLKKPGESFSDLINKLIENYLRSNAVETLYGVLADDKEAAEIFENATKEATQHFRWTD